MPTCSRCKKGARFTCVFSSQWAALIMYTPKTVICVRLWSGIGHGSNYGKSASEDDTDIPTRLLRGPQRAQPWLSAVTWWRAKRHQAHLNRDVFCTHQDVSGQAQMFGACQRNWGSQIYIEPWRHLIIFLIISFFSSPLEPSIIVINHGNVLSLSLLLLV